MYKRQPISETVTLLQLKNDIIEINEATISINHTLIHSQNSFGRDQWRSPPGISNQKATFSTYINHPIRNINGSIVSIPPSYAYEDNQLSIESITTNHNGTHNSIKIEMTRARLTSPTPPHIEQEKGILPIEFTEYGAGSMTDFRMTITNNKTAQQFFT